MPTRNMMTIHKTPNPNPNRWSLNPPHPMLFNANREATFRFIEEIHNCPDLWDIRLQPTKRKKKQANKNGTAVTVRSKEGISADIRFRPNLLFPALSVSSPAINIK